MSMTFQIVQIIMFNYLVIIKLNYRTHSSNHVAEASLPHSYGEF